MPEDNESKDYVRYVADVIIDAPDEIARFAEAKDSITLTIEEAAGPGGGWPIVRFTGPAVAVRWLLDALQLTAIQVDEQGVPVEGTVYEGAIQLG